MKGSIPKLEKAIVNLDKAKEWYPDYLSKYNNRVEDEVLVKVVNCNLFLLDPDKKLWEEARVSFLFSTDEKKLIRLNGVIKK